MITLSDSTWQALADEYDQPLKVDDWRHAYIRQGRENARALAGYVRERVIITTLADGRQALRLTDGVTETGPYWVPVEDPEPYESLAEMVEDFGWEVLVSDCYHDHPVFTREDNLRFRVWHDSGHIDHGLSFSADDEVTLFIAQARDIWTFNRSGNDREIVDALFCESVYQLAWAHVHGEFPDRQVVRTPGPVGRALLDAWGL